jgi:putative endonuclease
MTRTFDFQPATYFMANHNNGTNYIGVTSNLPKRAWQHREGAVEGFTQKHGCKRVVWYEFHATMQHAITREKQIKGGPRVRKIAH